ncbi:MAG: AAA family ATPase [gamma proteobacterium symbiont of Taylorina sp.]|nr:AAA family ATPase [gamma proteobacterium symbiont of Taylorina sp.]
MIINSISAKNVLKFEKLELNDIPEEGIIAISGFNESGKSTIGETICFALFGRTFSIDDKKLKKIIRWGASECSVTLYFTKNTTDTENEQFAISRMLDFAGNHSAKLYNVNDISNPIARGIESVEKALYDITAIKFEEFIESFYLAQREITTPHPHSYTLKSMAGISTLEHCYQEVLQDIEKDNNLSDEIKQQTAALKEEINELDIDALQLDSLVSEHNIASQNKTQTDSTLTEYQANIKEYKTISTKLSRSLSKKESGSFSRFLLFVLAVVSLILWFSLVMMPGEPVHGEISSLLQSNFPQFTATYSPYLLYISALSAILFLLLWLPVIGHNKNIKTLDISGIKLSQKMHKLDIARAIDADELRIKKMNQLTTGQVSEEEINNFTQDDLVFLTQQQKNQHDQVIKLSSALVIERERIKQLNEIQKKITEYQAQMSEIEAKNKTRVLSSQLLIGATKHLSTCFNQTLREHVSKTLPLFTESRYERLQIDEDLTVRIFSNNKYDFMELDEISSGTQRQIMLAVRLALSQEMVRRKVHSRQFMILDEPFAFFDEERTEKSLQELPQLSQDLTQVWVIAQTFPDNINFAKTIICERDIIQKEA